ncbi:MAG: hypothetical protein ACJA2W_003555 [Planctomycetota bacterium]|jgi:hypothetical protein
MYRGTSPRPGGGGDVVAAGEPVCVDPIHELELTNSQRELHFPQLALIAEVEGAVPGSSVFVVGSNAF